MALHGCTTYPCHICSGAPVVYASAFTTTFDYSAPPLGSFARGEADALRANRFGVGQ